MTLGYGPGRSIAAHTPASKAESLAGPGQIRVYPLSQDKPGQQNLDSKAVAHNVPFPSAVHAWSTDHKP
jgi:hypothetical protein